MGLPQCNNTIISFVSFFYLIYFILQHLLLDRHRGWPCSHYSHSHSRATCMPRVDRGGWPTLGTHSTCRALNFEQRSNCPLTPKGSFAPAGPPRGQRGSRFERRSTRTRLPLNNTTTSLHFRGAIERDMINNLGAQVKIDRSPNPSIGSSG
jgi:hypothetical protein